MLFPLTAVPFVNAVAFGTNETCKKLLHVSEDNMTTMQHIICGSMAGFAACFIVTPSEMVKCRLQIQFESKNKSKYKGVLDCVSKEYKAFGIKGIYKGFNITVLREVPGYAAQFLTYKYTKELLDNFNKRISIKKKQKELKNKSYNTSSIAQSNLINITNNNLNIFYNIDNNSSFYNNYESFDINDLKFRIPNLLLIMISGGFGGIACWVSSYPQDVIKTILQTNDCSEVINKCSNSNSNNKNILMSKNSNSIYFKSRFYDGGIYECSKYIYKKDGLYGFWRGFGVTCIRAFYANAVLFYFFEMPKDLLERYLL